MTVTVKTDNKLEVFRGDHGGTSLGTTSSGLTPGAFGYVEVKIVLHASAGTVLVKIDGATVLNLTSQNTANSGTAWDSFTTLGSAAGFSVNIDYDDLYLADGSGAAPWNDLLGDVRVDARVPTGAGATTGWTPSTGSNYANVDDATPDDDATYNSAATSPLTDTFVVQDAPVAGATIYGVQQCLSMKKSDSGTCTVALVVRHSGTDYVGSDLSPGMSYTYGLAITQTNPGTSAQWTESDFNAAEFGYRRTG
jgi:hypothetical protein